MPTTVKFFRRNLPHWLVADHSYFITLRLHGTLPKVVVKEFRKEREQLSKRNPDSAAVIDLRRQQFKKIERMLDLAGENNDWLSNHEVSSMVLENLDWFREKRG